MAITVSKTKPKVVPVQELLVNVNVADLTLEDLADRYGDLEDKLNALRMNPLFAQFAEVQKELSDRIKVDLEPEQTGVIKGIHWLIEIGSAAKNSRTLKNGAIPKIQAMLGQETFAKIAKVTIGDCEKYLTPDQTEQVIEADTGYSERRKIVAKFLG